MSKFDKTIYARVLNIPETFWFGRFDVLGKMVQLEETNVGIALVTVRLGDEEMDHFLTQKSAKIKRVGYLKNHTAIAVFCDHYLLQSDQLPYSSRIILDVPHKNDKTYTNILYR